MPYDVKKSKECSDSKPWAVVKDDGEVMGCHASQYAARQQQTALYAAERMERLVADWSQAEIGYTSCARAWFHEIVADWSQAEIGYTTSRLKLLRRLDLRSTNLKQK